MCRIYAWTNSRYFYRELSAQPMSEEEVCIPVVDPSMSTDSMITEMCEIARRDGKLVNGFRQVSSVIMREPAELVFLSKDHSKEVIEVVRSLCKIYEVPIIEMESSTKLASLVGIKKKCGVSMVHGFKSNSPGRTYVIKILRSVKSEQ